MNQGRGWEADLRDRYRFGGGVLRLASAESEVGARKEPRRPAWTGCRSVL